MQYELFPQKVDISPLLDFRNIYGLNVNNSTNRLINLNHNQYHITRLLTYKLVSRGTIRETLTKSVFIYSKPKFKNYVR